MTSREGTQGRDGCDTRRRVSEVIPETKPLERPVAIEVERFRSFRDRQVIELRPLTLLFGENNKGKSAALRLVPLLADSVRGVPGETLNLDAPSARSGSFTKMCWNQQHDRGCALGLRWADGSSVRYDFALERYELSASDSVSRVLVRSFFAGQGEHHVKLNHIAADDDATSAALRYHDESDREFIVTFEGLTPTLQGDATDGVVPKVQRHLERFARRVQWLAATRRAGVPRVKTIPTRPVWRMSPDGSDAELVLRSLPAVREAVAKWCRDWFRRNLMVEDTRDEFRIVFEPAPSGDEETIAGARERVVTVDLADHGEGVIQAIPVLTALESLRLGRQQSSNPLVLAIEEPEAHMHPTSQARLAKAVGATVRAARDASVILETHSPVLLQGLRLQVASGDLAPEDIALYWVQQDDAGVSRLERIEIDSRGDLPDWPESAFATEFELAREVLMKQESRGG